MIFLGTNGQIIHPIMPLAVHEKKALVNESIKTWKTYREIQEETGLTKGFVFNHISNLERKGKVYSAYTSKLKIVRIFKLKKCTTTLRKKRKSKNT